MHMLEKSTKNVPRRINFTNLKNPDGYIAKLKLQALGVSLQMT